MSHPRITVELMRRDLAEVTMRPSWWRRVLLRQDTQIEFASRSSGGAWIWDARGRAIEDERVLAALREAVFYADWAAEIRRRIAAAQSAADTVLDDLFRN